jgi:hypothetical protein
MRATTSQCGREASLRTTTWHVHVKYRLDKCGSATGVLEAPLHTTLKLVIRMLLQPHSLRAPVGAVVVGVGVGVELLVAWR